MFPGFVNAYRDKENHAHLYFFPGIDEHGNNIYNNIDMSEYMSSYTMINNDDNSIDICFYNNKIIRLNVKLIKNADLSEELVKLDV